MLNLAHLSVYYKDLSYGNYAIVAASVLIIYDWLITLDQEIYHFWPMKMRVGSILFLANRYIPILTQLLHLQTSVRQASGEASNKYCKGILFTVIGLQGISGAIVQVVLALRTQALYDNVRLGKGLLFLVAAGFINTSIYFILNALSSFSIPNHLPLPATGCILGGFKKSWPWEQYIVPLVFETIVLVLTTYKCVPWLRHKDSPNRSAYQILFRDGFIGSFVVCVSAIFALFVQIFRPLDLVTLGITFQPVIGIVACSRILLHIRDVISISPVESTHGSALPTIAIQGDTKTTPSEERQPSFEVENFDSDISVYDIRP